MYVVDMHNDSLSEVSASRGLVNRYNLSERYPALQLFAAYTPAEGTTPEARRQKLRQMANVYFYETERLGLRRIEDVRDLNDALYDGSRAAMLSVEGGGGLFADSEELYTLCRAGLRVLGPVWDTNELGASCYEKDDTGLTEEGKLLLGRAVELGITVDVSHLSDRGFYEVAELTGMPFIATHSNFREICPSRRNLTLDMARIITERGGVIGLNLYPEFLREGGGADISDILRHVDFALSNLGERSLAFGFDIDGTEGKYPIGLDETSSIHDRVIDELLRHYSEDTVSRIAGENALDFFKGQL